MKFLVLASALAVAIAAEIPSLSPISSVQGKAFNRLVIIWNENTDYDTNLKWLASHGITLSNYFAVTHPSQPNYISSVAGDYFGLNNDDHLEIPANISTIVDLLEAKGISWGSYQEDMPYTGFLDDFPNPVTKANMYVRKHNPLVSFDSVAKNPERLGRIKNTTLFEADLRNRQLPQWLFITPNMTSDGHDTSVTTAGEWTRGFIEPLMQNEYFMNDTLILITFDENHSYTSPNRLFTILMGGAVPNASHGTTDDNYYDHYSEISTVEANWGLSTLGRFDVGANVFSLVANKTGDAVRTHPDISSVYLNESYPGVFNGGKKSSWAPMPMPNNTMEWEGRKVLDSVVKNSQGGSGETYYTTDLVIPDKAHPPVYKKVAGSG
ncbi:phosphoesterase family-domain-containing protein [Sphaerosporella brunnea]|uniref:Phosphoesterase family-domain-containing protein n=1 Tax=Sphaerosporella brunnea TaxID=1250544 RepID=A0A5J5EDH4_9PEZI|nr:phosphoesterase family-domain-containing protein [Sphaerosporella brunnea]